MAERCWLLQHRTSKCHHHHTYRHHHHHHHRHHHASGAVEWLAQACATNSYLLFLTTPLALSARGLDGVASWCTQHGDLW